MIHTLIQSVSLRDNLIQKLEADISVKDSLIDVQQEYIGQLRDLQGARKSNITPEVTIEEVSDFAQQEWKGSVVSELICVATLFVFCIYVFRNRKLEGKY